MKIAILGDTHVGMRKDSPKFHRHAEKFFKLFFSELQQREITTVIQLGDLFDSRKSISPYSLSESKRYFFSHFSGLSNLKLIALIGNHDIYWRESLKVNTPSQVLGMEYNIHIVDKPTNLLLDNVHVDIIPWICEENRQDCFNFIKNSTSEYCFGHFEISGACMYKGTKAHDGIGTEQFASYRRVFSGHFHTQSIIDNVQYVGTPYEITWEDCGDPRGFHILDTETGEIEFVENPHTMFKVVTYDGTSLNINKEELHEKIVKVIVKKKENLYEFENCIASLSNSGVYDIKIIENSTSQITSSDIDDTIELKDTLSILKSYIDTSDIDNKDAVKSYIESLYLSAINLEVV